MKYSFFPLLFPKSILPIPRNLFFFFPHFIFPNHFSPTPIPFIPNFPKSAALLFFPNHFSPTPIPFIFPPNFPKSAALCISSSSSSHFIRPKKHFYSSFIQTKNNGYCCFMFFLYHTSFSFITTTNFCPPNFALPSDNGGWCNPRWPHFDLAMPMFLKIAEYCTGIVPISFQ
ncbi:hypothetical protein ES332_D10G251200v1 [Gossypium tomentosum]|nr:hypothetical protein ES332_D10G251200v1 [Gossypium tomentosum]